MHVMPMLAVFERLRFAQTSAVGMLFPGNMKFTAARKLGPGQVVKEANHGSYSSARARNQLTGSGLDEGEAAKRITAG